MNRGLISTDVRLTSGFLNAMPPCSLSGVAKTIASYAPHARHSFDYRQGSTVDCQQGWTVKAILVRLLMPAYRVFVWFFPGQQNLFAARITKPNIPRDLHPWLLQQNGKIVFNRGWSPDASRGRTAKTGG